MNQDRVYCYTGTGNSYAAAKQISEYFNIPVEFITAEAADAPEVIECDFAVLVCPSYAYGVPKLVKRFLKNRAFKAGYLAVVITYGSSPRGTAAEAVKILKRKGQSVDFAGGTKSVENFVHLFGHQDPEKAERLCAEQKETVAELCKKLENREKSAVSLFRPLSGFVSGIFRAAKPMFAASYKITKDCNACGICRRVCPPDAITLQEKNGRVIPRFKARKCDHCQACMQLCPQKAIRFGRIKPDSPRYLHGDVKLNELLKRK